MGGPERSAAGREIELAARIPSLPERDPTDDLADGWIDTQDGVARANCDPHALCRDSDRSGLDRQPDPPDDFSRAWVDSQQRVVVAIADPDGAFADRDTARSRSNRDLVDDEVRRGIDH